MYTNEITRKRAFLALLSENFPHEDYAVAVGVEFLYVLFNFRPETFDSSRGKRQSTRGVPLPHRAEPIIKDFARLMLLNADYTIAPNELVPCP